VIEEDDDENDDGKDVTSATDGPEQQGIKVQEKEKKTVVTSMVDRLKRRAARSAELAQQKIKRKKSKTEDNEKNKSSNNPSDASKAAKKEQSIPKKPRKSQTIPKKSIGEKNGPKNEEDGAKKETPSLLSQMKKPPSPVASLGKSSAGIGSTNVIKKKPRPFHSSWGATQTPGSPSGIHPANVASTTPPPTSAHFVDLSGPTDEVHDSTVPTVTKAETGDGNKFGSGLRQLALDGIRDLCKDMFEIPPERKGVDLFASFLRHKDLKMTMRASGNSIDSNNNAATTNNQQYDFFDIDETTGAIMLQPKIPIFPEDFARAGTKEWPLSWWGIVDPGIGNDKAESKIDADTESRSKTRRDRSNARSDSGKDGSGDRKRRDNGRHSRQRSSRDTYDDEHAYFDGHPSREDRRDKFPPGEYDGGGDGHPPRFRDTDYDYDHNGPPPNRYPPDSRHPYHRGGGGGPQYPHRTRDGPPPHSRPYPRGGPPPADFRGGGGGRPYPAHGSSGPREYPHRDQFEPQGRDSIPPRDERREHRDRPQFSPHSKSERDDARQSARNPPTGSSSRKERTRTSR